MYLCTHYQSTHESMYLLTYAPMYHTPKYLYTCAGFVPMLICNCIPVGLGDYLRVSSVGAPLGLAPLTHKY